MRKIDGTSTFAKEKKDTYIYTGLTFAASKIFCTAVDISGPIPSPGIRVHLRRLLQRRTLPSFGEICPRKIQKTIQFCTMTFCQFCYFVLYEWKGKQHLVICI